MTSNEGAPTPPISLTSVLADARSRLERVRPEELEREVENGAIVVDVRDSLQRTEQGILPGAHVIDLTILEWRLAPSSPHRTIEIEPGQRVILVCRQGYSSSLAADRLRTLGVVGATDLIGGFEAWSARHGSSATPREGPVGDDLQR